MKGFYRYVSRKKMVKESVPPLMSKTGKLATADEEKAEVLNNFFASVFTGNLSPHPSRVNEHEMINTPHVKMMKTGKREK